MCNTVGALSQFVSEIEKVTGRTDLQNKVESRLPWYSASVDSTYLTGKRVFLMAPLHHHFEKKGWPESTVVVRFWIISIILAMIGLATLKLR